MKQNGNVQDSDDMNLEESNYKKNERTVPHSFYRSVFFIVLSVVVVSLVYYFSTYAPVKK